MKKKLYITPAIENHDIATVDVICGSGAYEEYIEGGNLPDPFEPEDDGGGIWGESKGNGFDYWDNEDVWF